MSARSVSLDTEAVTMQQNTHIRRSFAKDFFLSLSDKKEDQIWQIFEWYRRTPM